jgi:kynurenine formamidase
VRESGEETGVHRKGRGLRVGRALLGEDVAQVFGLVHEMVRAERSRVMCMPKRWEGSPGSFILNHAPS